MSLSRRDLMRLVAFGSAAAVIGVPIVLMASTWKPLEPAPRGSSDEESDAPERTRRKDRQDEDEPVP